MKKVTILLTCFLVLLFTNIVNADPLNTEQNRLPTDWQFGAQKLIAQCSDGTSCNNDLQGYRLAEVCKASVKYLTKNKSTCQTITETTAMAASEAVAPPEPLLEGSQEASLCGQAAGLLNKMGASCLIKLKDATVWTVP